eukprot:gene8531-43992_t
MAIFYGGWDAKVPGVPLSSVRLLVASFTLYVPIVRELYLGLGFVDASRRSMDECLKRGYSVMLLPGGATEALYCNDEDEPLVLRARPGFVRAAVRSGASLVPVFTFGESDHTVFDHPAVGSGRWRRQRAIQQIVGINFPYTPQLPRPLPCLTVVGKPVALIPADPLRECFH